MIFRNGKLIVVIKNFKLVIKMLELVVWFKCIGKIRLLVLKNKLNNIEFINMFFLNVSFFFIYVFVFFFRIYKNLFN